MSYKNFSNLNNKVSSYAPSAALSLLTELDSLTQEAIRIASELPNSWSRSYSSVMIMKYDDQGNPSDVTDTVAPNAKTTVDNLINSAVSKIKILNNRFDTIREQISQVLTTVHDVEVSINQSNATDESTMQYNPIPVYGSLLNHEIAIDLGTDVSDASKRILVVSVSYDGSQWSAKMYFRRYEYYANSVSFRRTLSMKSNLVGSTNVKRNVAISAAKFNDDSFISVGYEMPNDFSAVNCAVTFRDAEGVNHSYKINLPTPPATNTTYTLDDSSVQVNTCVTNIGANVTANVDVDLVDVLDVDAATIGDVESALEDLL